MKKLLGFMALMIVLCSAAYAQSDTLLYENFNADPTGVWSDTATGSNNIWISYNGDTLIDKFNRPDNWYWSDTAFSSVDTTGCMVSNSWFVVRGAAANYLITPPIMIADSNAVLSWRSAPRQTPLYLDGYKVLLSTTDNLPTSFTNTLFIAGEHTAGTSAGGFDFSAYSFSPGFLHGADSLFIEADPVAGPAMTIGVLRPFSAGLSAFAGQTVYIAFLHDAYDDNQIAIDDILVTGTAIVGTEENGLFKGARLYPNPASERVMLRFNQVMEPEVRISIYGADGRLMKTSNMNLNGMADEVSIPVGDLMPGTYVVHAEGGRYGTRLPLVIVR